MPAVRVRIVTTLTVDGGKTHRGTLRGLRGEAVGSKTERGELLLPMATIKSANLEYDPRADLRRDKRQRKQSNGNIRKRNTEDKLIDVLQFIAKERNISFEMLLEALEAALLTAYKRHFGSESNAIVIVDRQSGAYRVFHRRTVVEP